MLKNINDGKSKSIKNNLSSATSYSLSILEEKVKNNISTASRAANAFKSLEEILPHCGIYTPLLKIITDELKEAVYSNRFTSCASLIDGSPVLERIPYFVLLERYHNEKEDKIEVLKEFEKKHKADVLKLQKKIQEKDEQISSILFELQQLKTEKEKLIQLTTTQEDEIIKIEKKIALNRKIADDDIHHFKVAHEKLLSSNALLKEEIEKLMKYKVSYSRLKDTFDLPTDKRPRRGFRRPVISTKKTQLLANIEAASKLEQQMIEVQSKSLEEYDVFLEKIKKQLSNKKLSDNENDSEYFTEELQLETLRDEMKIRMKNFQRLITGMIVELELVREHRENLQNELSRMEQAENMATGDAASNAGTLPPSSMAGGPGSSRLMIHEETDKKTCLESLLSFESGLEENSTPLVDPNSDPFNPHEKLLSKYSVMLYTSTNSGKTFEEISTAVYCISCGEKTAVCPHKVTKSDLIIPLPLGCTHIKISRPTVCLNIPLFGQEGIDIHGQQEGVNWLPGILTKSQSWNQSDVDMSVHQQLAPLWNDAKRRAGIDSASPSVCASRDLLKDRIISIIHQFYGSISWSDEYLPLSDHVTTFRGYLYQFMNERYQEDEISTVAAYDFITGIVKYAEQDKTILLLGLALAGLIDGSAVRYTLIVADLLDDIEWKSVNDFQAFTCIFFPFLEDDDVDQFVLEYNAYSENKISKQLVLGYIIQSIIKQREPRLKLAESKLSSCKMKQFGQMTKEEFLNAMETIAPLANDHLLKKLVLESMHSVGLKQVPLKRLASVAAYVSLLLVWQLLKSQINEKMDQARENSNKVLIKLHGSERVIVDDGQMITMSKIKNFASNISRLRQSEINQSEQSFHDDS